jgi:hypothetical protein
MPPIVPSADRGVIEGSGRSRPQESHSTPTRNQCQSCRETEKKHIQRLHTINLLTSFEVLLYMGIAEATCEPRGHKATDVGATRCLCRPCALISDAAILPLRPVAIICSLLCGLLLQEPSGRPVMPAGRPLWSSLERPGRERNVRPRPKNYCSPEGQGNDGGLTSGSMLEGYNKHYAV